MMGSRGLLASALLLLALAAGCETTRLAASSSFAETVSIYSSSPEKKALALAADEHGRRVWGASIGSKLQGRANDDALEECRKNAAHRGLEAHCYLFAVGNAPAAETLEACSQGRVNPKRCAAQDRFPLSPGG